MSGDNQLRIAATAVLMGLAAMSADLRWAWQHAPYDQGAGVIAAIWLMGVMYAALKLQSVPIARLVMAAVALGLVSFIGELNVVRHLAMVLVLVAWLPGWWVRILVGVAGICWWPALGWATAQFTGPAGTLVVRIALLAMGLLTLLRKARMAWREDDV